MNLTNNLKNSLSFKTKTKEYNNIIQEKDKKLHIFEKYLYYIIDSKNNSKVISEALKSRPYWREISSKCNSLFNLKWKETSSCINFSKLNKICSFKQVRYFNLYI